MPGDVSRSLILKFQILTIDFLLQIWSVLTNYNKLASFVPNLEHCERVSGAPPGKQRLLQRASSQSIFCRLQAEAVLDVQEVIMALGRRELVFTMVSGDFQVPPILSEHLSQLCARTLD